jgi:hypothetical protein
MKPSPRGIVASVASVFLILLLNTCGLETFIQLNPPGNPVRLGDQFLFTKTLYNSEPEFTGFDLYYRFFDSGVTPELDDIIQFEDLGIHGFRRIHGSSDNQGTLPPLMYVQPGDRTPGASPPDNDQFTLTVDFTGKEPSLALVDPFPQIEGDGTADVDFSEIAHTDIRRDVWDESASAYKQFSDFSAGDADISQLSDDIAGGAAVQLVLYAVSYGYDFNNYRRLHSEPVKLGTITRSFP